MNTLVLSTAYQPMKKISWRRAMELWVAGKVEVLAEYEDKFIRTCVTRYKVPSVVRYVKNVFKRYDQSIKYSKHNVFIRDNGYCQYCEKHLKRSEATFDHVIPRSKGGKSDWNNIVTCCLPCNQKKGNKNLEDINMRLKKKPIRPNFLSKSQFKIDNQVPKEWKLWLGV